MPENKTTWTGPNVEDYLASRAGDQQSKDCRKVMALLGRITGQPPKMWGPSIVGYGKYRYTSGSGRTGEAPVIGFAIRGREIVIYLDGDGGTQKALLSKLGKHRMGKCCLYFKRLSDLDFPVLEALAANSVAATTGRSE